MDYVIFGRESRNAIMNGKTLPKGPNNIEKALQLPWIADVEDDFVDVDEACVVDDGEQISSVFGNAYSDVDIVLY